MGIGGQHRQAVAGGDEKVAAQDHVAVAVAIGGGAEVQPLRPLAQGHQLLGVRQVGVRVTAAEVLQGHAVHDSAGGGAEAVLEDLGGIGAGDGVHGIQLHAELAAGEEAANGLEVEEAGHEVGVIGHRVQDLYPHLAKLAVTPRRVDVQFGGREGAVTLQAWVRLWMASVMASLAPVRRWRR
jgi:hypothetical protein